MADNSTPAKKSIFIVKAKAESLHAAEIWLKSKDWTVQSTTSIKDALPQILALKPNFIILCMDHPNQKVRMLPKLFEQAFHTKVIAYLEGTSPSSLVTISGMEYVLYPPVSGTAMDRMTAKVDRDRRRKIQMEEQRAASGLGKASLGTTGSGMISIKGEARDKHEDVRVSEQARSALMQMINENNQSASSSAYQDNKKSTMIVTGTSGGPAHAPGMVTPGSSSRGASGTQTATPSEPKSLSASAPIPSPNPPPVDPFGGLPPPSDDDVAAAVKAMLAAAAGGNKGKDPKTPHPTAATTLGATHVDSAAKGQGPTQLGKDIESRAQSLKKAKTIFSHVNKEKGYDENSGIVLGTQKAIDEIASETPHADVLPLRDCNTAICFFVTSKSHQGFVLCSISHNPEPLHMFVDVFKNRLSELMTEFDGNFLTSPAVEVSMQNVNFDNWVKQQAAFSKKFVHLDRECGIAFFELAPPQPTLSPSTNKDMVKMDLVDVKGERKLLFDVFLYLPLNKKFILYNRRGNKFANKQKDQLIKRGVSDIHLHNSEVEQLHRYHLEAYLDQKIAEHLETLKTPNAGSF